MTLRSLLTIRRWLSLTAFVGLLLLVSPAPSTAGVNNGFHSTAPLASDDSLAYMDLKLTAEDEAGGDITTDEAISLYFRTDATDDWDSYDASKLFPRGDTWAVMAFEGVKGGEEVLKAQESRPHKDSVQVVDVKLVRKNMPAATYTLSVQKWYSVPPDWSLKLRSQALDTTFVIEDETDTITFNLGASKTHLASGGVSSTKSTSDTTHMALAGEVGPPSSTLPVELSSFTADLDGDRAKIQWQTASETNNSGFAIEHQRPTAAETETQWSRVGFRQGHGTTNRTQQYQFSSSSLSPGTHFFRLKQIDYDGSVHYSKKIKISHRPNRALTVTAGPNPFSNRLRVAFTARSTQTVRIRLVDMLGRVVHQSGPVKATANVPIQKQIDAQRLSSGSYLLHIEGERTTTSRRVIHID